MKDDSCLSRHGVPVRLSDERWQHRIEEHAELAGMRAEVLRTIAEAEKIVRGATGERLAVQMIEPDKAIVVVYRETNDGGGFVITAFFTRRLASLNRREQIWPLPM